MAAEKPAILFLCTGNSCRSQMAEGWLRHLKGSTFTAYSAGIETHGLNPYAVQVMKEAGVDISDQESLHINAFTDTDIDLIISVCSHADKHCPIFSKPIKRIHHGFDDPPKLAKGLDGEARLDCYRKVRDQIKGFITNFKFEK